MSSPYRWVILAVTFLGFIQTHLHRLGFAGLIPVFVGDLGLSYAAAGTIHTAYFWSYAIAQIPIGVWADRWGPRRVMIGSMIVLAVGGVAFAMSRTYVESIAARVIVGLGAAGMWVPGMRLTIEWFPLNERARVAGVISSGGGVGATLGLIVVPWLATLMGWRLAYGLLVVPAIATLIAFAVFLRPSDGGAASSTGSGALGRLLRDRDLWPFNVSVCFAFGGYFSFVTFVPAFLVRGMGFTTAQAGLITSLITAATIVAWPLAGVVSDRLGRRKPIYFFSQATSVLVCLAFAWVVPGLPTSGTIVMALLAGLLIGGMILPFVMIVELYPPALAGTAAGIVNCACFLGSMVLPIVLGRVVDVTGSFAIAFIVAGAVQVLACVSVLFLVETGPAVRVASARR